MCHANTDRYGPTHQKIRHQKRKYDDDDDDDQCKESNINVKGFF